MLELKNVSYCYKGNQSNTLNNINYEFEAGKFYTILGKSGSGKTTLLSLMAGLDTPTDGQVLFKHQDIREVGYANHRKQNISLVFQNYNLLDYLTPLENIQLVNPKADKALLLELGLEEELLSRNILKLSGGQQQRVAIARALVSNTPTILLDEPTGNLDFDIANEVTSLLKEYAHKKKKCVIMVTHSREISKLADVSLNLSSDSLTNC
ncbi:ATP-binding cassette domain-containing protein [Streptococcus castoreus]|uniref:ATP-binding cassette domain-containing protein n=1 Tax=Streptococcus castoreus TaxID=254786 RepID=UPI000427B36D|nr:ABC transporter ATP-binding protein [Streptococcus castoreus]